VRPSLRSGMSLSELWKTLSAFQMLRSLFTHAKQPHAAPQTAAALTCPLPHHPVRLIRAAALVYAANGEHWRRLMSRRGHFSIMLLPPAIMLDFGV